jgi:hypothetical protein
LKSTNNLLQFQIDSSEIEKRIKSTGCTVKNRFEIETKNP